MGWDEIVWRGCFVLLLLLWLLKVGWRNTLGPGFDCVSDNFREIEHTCNPHSFEMSEDSVLIIESWSNLLAT
jgi:hypothetical protein